MNETALYQRVFLAVPCAGGMKSLKSILLCSLELCAVSIWAVTGQGVKNIK